MALRDGGGTAELKRKMRGFTEALKTHQTDSKAEAVSVLFPIPQKKTQVKSIFDAAMPDDEHRC